jgi:hypothetical protein
MQAHGGKMAEQQQAPQVQIKVDEKDVVGHFSNLVMIHHNPEEFTMHFIYVFTNGTQGKLVASTIVTPGHAKRLWRALGENISRFEAQFGPIKESPSPAPAPNVGFVQ